MSGSEYDEENPCIQFEVPRFRCTICKGASEKRKVGYITSGGNCYHLNINCSALESGQAQVDARGGTRADINTQFVDILRVTRDLCRNCGGGFVREQP